MTLGFVQSGPRNYGEGFFEFQRQENLEIQRQAVSDLSNYSDSNRSRNKRLIDEINQRAEKAKDTSGFLDFDSQNRKIDKRTTKGMDPTKFPGSKSNNMSVLYIVKLQNLFNGLEYYKIGMAELTEKTRIQLVQFKTVSNRKRRPSILKILKSFIRGLIERIE